MKYSFYYLFFICSFLISCNKGVYFFSAEDESAINSIDHDLYYTTQKQPYVPPHKEQNKEQTISFSDQKGFIQLASADISQLHLSENRPIDVSIVPKDEHRNFSQSQEGLSTLPSIVVGALSADKLNMEGRGEELDLRREEREPLVFSITEGETPQYPALPELALKSRARKPNEVLIPEGNISLGGQKGFIQLASADISQLHLSENRPIDVSIVPKDEHRNFSQSQEGLSTLPSIVVGALSADKLNMEGRGEELDLRREEREPLVFSITEGETPQYPALPELALKSRARKPNEVLIPEGNISLGGQKGFIQLASANISSLRLPASRLIDVTSEPKEEESQFIQSRYISTLSSVMMGEVPVHNMDTEEGGVKLGLEKQERGELTFSIAEGGQLDYSSSPEWVLGVDEESAPGELFIPRLLDILFIIDTSESMHKHLISFKAKFAPFLRHFSNFNWKLAITNADHGENGFFLFNIGSLKGEAMKLEEEGAIVNLRYLDRRIENYNGIFLDSISRHRLYEYQKLGQNGWEDVGYCELPPYCQGANEQPLKSLKSALDKNPDFFRKNADLVVVVISNSKERAGDYESGVKPEEVIEQFRNLHGDKKRFEVYGIIIFEDDVDCLKQNKKGQFLFPEGAFSEKIAHLSQMTEGSIFSICSHDYEELAYSIFQSFGRDKTK